MNWSYEYEIVVKHPWLRKIVTWLKKYFKPIAFLGIVSTILQFFFPILFLPAAALDILLASAVFVTFTRVVVAKPEPVQVSVSVNPVEAKRMCPKCGNELKENPDDCSNCNWSSDN